MGRKKISKPNEHYRFESKGKLKQCKDGKWRHRFINDSGNEQTDTTIQIMYSMIISPAFKDLTARQRMLYVYAKSQFFGALSRPANDFKDEYGNTLEKFQQYQGRECFYLNHKLMSEVFGLYPKTNHRDLYFDIEALIQRGFIERVTGQEQKDVTELELEKIRETEREKKKNRIKKS